MKLPESTLLHTTRCWFEKLVQYPALVLFGLLIVYGFADSKWWHRLTYKHYEPMTHCVSMSGSGSLHYTCLEGEITLTLKDEQKSINAPLR